MAQKDGSALRITELSPAQHGPYELCCCPPAHGSTGAVQPFWATPPPICPFKRKGTVVMCSPGGLQSEWNKQHKAARYGLAVLCHQESTQKCTGRKRSRVHPAGTPGSVLPLSSREAVLHTENPQPTKGQIFPGWKSVPVISQHLTPFCALPAGSN